MLSLRCWAVPWLLLLVWSAPRAQMPFYTDDTEVTEPGTLHVEAFNELDALQSAQYPDLRQNTINLKLNTGLPYRFELDLDAPYLAIYRAAGSSTSRGIGDTNFGLKWKMREAVPQSHFPALAISFYVEVPTGNTRQELGSGLTDYWLNFIAQEPISEHTRINVNVGILFAGNTSTGVVGIETTRGHVLTGGLSLVHDLNERLSVGGEVYGGIADNDGLHRSQLQLLLGAQYGIRDNVTLCLGVVGGEYAASPRIGGQIGIAVDFPRLLSSPDRPTPMRFAVGHDRSLPRIGGE
jgi:hypothetical protein